MPKARRVSVHYDGSTFRVTGWLDVGEAIFSIPRGGRVEIFSPCGAPELLILDRDGRPRDVQVENA